MNSHSDFCSFVLQNMSTKKVLVVTKLWVINKENEETRTRYFLLNNCLGHYLGSQTSESS